MGGVLTPEFRRLRHATRRNRSTTHRPTMATAGSCRLPASSSTGIWRSGGSRGGRMIGHTDDRTEGLSIDDGKKARRRRTD